MKQQLTRGLRVAAIVAAGGAAALFGFAAPAAAAAPATVVTPAGHNGHNGHNGHHGNRNGHHGNRNNHRQSGNCRTATHGNVGTAACNHLSAGTRVTLIVTCMGGRHEVRATKVARHDNDAFLLRASCGGGRAVHARTIIGHRGH